PLLIASAGYLTSCGYGAMLLALSRHGRRAEMMLILNAGVITAVTFAFSDDLFTMVIGIALSVGLLIAANARIFWGHFLLNFLAVQCCINAILDLRTLLRVASSSGLHSDALIMEKVTLIPAWLWAVTWAILAGLFLLLGLHIYARSGSGRK
ncbi:MAG: M50 family metallopeptidase, partial [Acidobacteriota bacterium]